MFVRGIEFDYVSAFLVLANAIAMGAALCTCEGQIRSGGRGQLRRSIAAFTSCGQFCGSMGHIRPGASSTGTQKPTGSAGTQGE